MPYKNEQCVEYGPTFAPWTDDDIGQMIGSLSAGLQLNSIAVVVHMNIYFLNTKFFIDPPFDRTRCFREKLDEAEWLCEIHTLRHE